MNIIIQISNVAWDGEEAEKKKAGGSGEITQNAPATSQYTTP
jgi:hypothetical protein